MNLTREERCAAGILRRLLDGQQPGDWAGGVDGQTLAALAGRNGVLIRTAERLEKDGVRNSDCFIRAVEAERRRVQTAVQWIARISALCQESGVEYLFPKAFQHYPDMGQDLDLLLLSRSLRAECPVVAALPVAPCRRNMSHRIAGTTCYLIEGCALPLDVHHGRLGLAGEHTVYPAILTRSRRSVQINGSTFMVPSREDELILQGERVYGRRYLRLADIVATSGSLRQGGLDWDSIVRTSRQLGTLTGLSGYLRAVDAVHAGVLGSHLLTREQSRCLESTNWGPMEFRAGRYQLPAGRIAARLYGRKLAAVTAAGDWRAAGRLCLLPLVVITRSAAAGRNRLDREYAQAQDQGLEHQARSGDARVAGPQSEQVAG